MKTSKIKIKFPSSGMVSDEKSERRTSAGCAGAGLGHPGLLAHETPPAEARETTLRQLCIRLDAVIFEMRYQIRKGPDPECPPSKMAASLSRIAEELARMEDK